MKQWNICILVLVVMILLCSSVFAENRNTKKILILHSYHTGYEWTDEINKGISETLNSAEDVEVYVEYMDLIRNPSAESLTALEGLYKIRYSADKVEPDVIIVSDDPAFNFILEKRDKLFKDIPVVFCGINNFTRERIKGHRNITGINESISVKETAEIALKMRDKAVKMGIVSCSNITMRQNLELFKKYELFFKDRIKLVYLSALEPDDLSSQLKQFSRDDIILYLGYLKTPEGKEFTVKGSLDLIRGATDAAIFGCWDFLINNGVVGGKVVHGYSQGEAAAESALEIVKGGKADRIPVKMESPNRYIFDDTLLDRYNVSEKIIPPGSIVVNQTVDSLIRDWDRIRNTGFFTNTLFENHGSIMMVVDLESGIIVDANRAAHSFYGYSHLINKTVYDLNPQPQEELREVLMRSARLKENHYTTEHVTSDNQIKYVDIYSYPVVINNRTFLFGVVHDVTDEIYAANDLNFKNKIIFFTIISGLIFLSFYTFFLLKNISERKRSEEKNKSLLAEKELLLKEVHHRIKNNMNTIKGLLTLQILSEENPDTEASLRSAESRVHSMIMLYDRLYCTDNYRELSLKDYLEPLTEEIVGGFPGNVNVKIETDINDYILNVRLLSPLGIIVNELLTNIMKYAFIGRDSGIISISAGVENSRARVVIRDNGVGIPESVNFGRSTGFGLDLVKMLAEQIEGTISIDRGAGTILVLEFPV